MSAAADRWFAPYRDDDRADAASFLVHAHRIDDSGVIRAKQRPDARVGLWARTGFDVLATRSVFGTLEPTDAECDVAALAAGLAEPGVARVGIGFPLPGAWQGALPPHTGFVHLDDVPAREALELSRKGVEVAREESGALGPASSLLDQPVLRVSAGDGDSPVGVTMRSLFALTAMEFAGSASDEVIRIRVGPAWLRIDARFGSIYQRRSVLNVSVV